MTGAFDIPFDELPREIPVFPLEGVILLPRTQLPLNIFEPRYLAMVSQSMKNGRLIGMIQPKSTVNLFKTGCAGRIVSFSETEDGRYMITLKGICRFNIAEELPLDPQGFRRVRPDWAPFKQDCRPDESTEVCRDALTKRLHAYLSKMEMNCDRWEEMKTISCEKLISTLCVVCPFDAHEKQALLEAPDLKERARLLDIFLDNKISGRDCDGEEICH